jgi:imidazolonepropionase-like amidohydrolase
MRSSVACVGVAIVALAAQAAPPPAAIVVRAARLVDVRRGAIVANPVVVVVDGRFSAVGSSDQIRVPPGAGIVDLGDVTLLPGLIDGHVHLSLAGRADANAAATLLAGFTTVQDLGALDFAMLAVRDSVRAGQLRGPRIIAAGPWLGVTGGICDFNGIGLQDVAAFTSRVREAVARGVDVIKVCVTGWVNDGFANPQSVEISDSALAAVVREAHGAGRKVVAHAIGAAGVRLAVQSGVDAIAHAGFADSETVELMKRRAVWIMPTLQSFSPESATAHGQALVSHMRWMIGHHVPVAFGTDAGVIRHGRNAREFTRLQHVGLSPAEALRAATINAARMLGLDEHIGAVETGKDADLIAVAGNPLEDLTSLQRVVFVIQQGRVVRRDSAGPP